jgi:putative ABC transport system permease protein
MSNLRFAFRRLAASPGFTTIAVVTLALGVGLNTAMFSVLNTLLLRPLPFPDPDRLFRLDRTSAQQPDGSHRGPNYLDIERHSGDVADVAAYRGWGATVSEPGRPAEFRESLRVSPRFFDVLSIRPALGRTFRMDEDAVGRNHVIVLSERYWRSRFDADPNIVGRVVRLDGQSTEIVGVLPASVEALALFGPIDLFRPLALTEEERSFRSETFFQILGRYRTGVAPAAAEAHFATVARRLAADHAENAGLGLRTVPLQSTTVSDATATITYLLLGLSGFVLLIACANLANLLIARAMSRSREFAVRVALGASSARLIGPVAAECLMIALAGGALGIQLSIWTTQWMGRQLSDERASVVFVLDWRVLGFAMAATFATALVVGVAPAWLVSRLQVNNTLKGGTRGSTADPSQHRFRNALIVGQLALALVLLAGAAVFALGLNQLAARESGWNPAPLLSGKVSLRGDGDQARTFRAWRQLRERLAALPGVERASVDLDLPLYGFAAGQRAYVIEGRERPNPGHEPTALTNGVSPEYFDTVGTPLIRGRGILLSDTLESPRVVVINETMARTLFPRGDAIGHRLGRVDRDPQWAEIVGVARDVRFLGITALPTTFQVYQPLSQETWGFASATVRAVDPATAAALVQPFRRAVAEFDPDIAVLNLRPVPAEIADSNRGLVTITQLLAGFAGLGLFLAALGIYGVITRLVAQRTPEIGVRMALGATFDQVLRLVLGAGLRMTLVGVGLGLLGAIALTRLLNTQLPGLATNNAVTISAAAVLLLAVSILACYVPARRASKVDPLVAMRTE